MAGAQNLAGIISCGRMSAEEESAYENHQTIHRHESCGSHYIVSHNLSLTERVDGGSRSHRGVHTSVLKDFKRVCTYGYRCFGSLLSPYVRI